MLVVDASVLAVALADDGLHGNLARTRLRDEELVAPELIDLEVVSVLRQQRLNGALNARRAQLALDDLKDLPLHRAPHLPLVSRCWELHENLTPYDAAYVALAEALEAVLLTADTRMANAPRIACAVEVLRAAPRRG